VRVEAHWVETNFSESDDDDINGVIRRIESAEDNWTTRVRGNVRLDSRTQTDWGMVRAFINFQGTIGPGDGFSDEASPIDSDPNYSGSGFDLDQAFIQIARDSGTFTAGHVDSFFDAPFSSNTFGTRIGIDDPTGSQTLFGYTFAGGNGFSASISIEDPSTKPGRFNSGNGVNTDDDYEGQELPDLIVNARFDQGWGSLFAAAAFRDIHDIGGSDPIDNGDDNGGGGDGFGWAANAGFIATFGIIGAGLTVGYADGALNYVTNDPGGVGDFSGPDGSDTNKAWAVRGGLTASFSPTMVAQIDASYTDVEENNDGAFANDVDESYNTWAVVADLVWKPVDGLIMGPEIAYREINFNGGESDEELEEEAGDEDLSQWGVMWRIQRDF
jgi:hypothetical protein